VQNNPPLNFAMQMARVIRPGDTIFYREFTSDDWILRYFNPEARWEQIGEISAADMAAKGSEIRRRGRNGWVESSAIKYLSGGRPDWVPDGRRKYELRDSKRDLRLYAIHNSDSQ
jgi:hypothetical protein